MSSTSTSGWNRGASAAAKPAPKKPSSLRGLVAGGAIILIGIVALYFVTGEKEERQAVKNGSSKIADAKADIASQVSTNVMSAAIESAKIVPAKPMWYDADTNSAAYKVYHHKGPVVTNNFIQKTSSLAARIFTNTADKQIGQLISVEPGAMLVGDIKYDEKFVKKFLESLKTPIIIDPADSEKVKVLKKALREAKIELKEAYDNGEDIAKIMTDTRRELKELGAYKKELQDQVLQIVKKDAKNISEQDMQDYIDAANKMLESRGCKPMVMPAFMRHRLEILHRNETQE